MATFTIIALLAGVAGAVGRPFGLPSSAVPLVAAAVVVVAGGLSLDAARRALDPLGEPVGFLLAAVPLAVALDGYGYFSAVARLVTRGERGTGGLWILAALVTTVLNLDAAVVLLTPLYVTIARRTGRDPLTLALMPVLLACLASSALPVSNLTNLIAESATGASSVAFLANLGLPSLAATTVGWWLYRRLPTATRHAAPPGPAEAGGAEAGGAGLGGAGLGGAGLDGANADGADERTARTVLFVGSLVVALVLVGFTCGRLVGVAPWAVALAADAVLVAVRRVLPWRAIPVGTALVALSLGLLASAAVAHLPVHRLLSGTGSFAQLRITGVMALAANVANNLPALLVALPSLGHRASGTLWSVLLGVNMGPVLLATGSLASLLWLDALGRLGVAARPRDFSAAGLRIGLPAAAAGVAVHLGLAAAGVA